MKFLKSEVAIFFGESMRKLDILHSHGWLYFVIQETKPWEKLNDLPQAIRDWPEKPSSGDGSAGTPPPPHCIPVGDYLTSDV